jgi:hypothetical protein
MENPSFIFATFIFALTRCSTLPSAKATGSPRRTWDAARESVQ